MSRTRTRWHIAVAMLELLPMTQSSIAAELTESVVSVADACEWAEQCGLVSWNGPREDPVWHLTHGPGSSVVAAIKEQRTRELAKEQSPMQHALAEVVEAREKIRDLEDELKLRERRAESLERENRWQSQWASEYRQDVDRAQGVGWSEYEKARSTWSGTVRSLRERLEKRERQVEETFALTRSLDAALLDALRKATVLERENEKLRAELEAKGGAA